MPHRYRPRFFLLLTVALVMLLLPPSAGRSVRASDGDCEDCTTTCINERQFCLENGGAPTVCTANYKSCLRYCFDNFCQTR